MKSAVEVSWSYGTQQNIGMGVLSNISITYPSIKEQNQIIEYLNKHILGFENLIENNILSIEKLKEYRQSLISEAVTGKIDVRDWQPKKQAVA